MASKTTEIMQDQMTFLIKSFFFFLIGLMFPTDFRLIVLGTVGALFLFAMRIPAVMLATKGQRMENKDKWFLNVCIPRGLAAGVLATLPMAYGVPGAENLAPAIFALIVITVLVFALGFPVVGRMPEESVRPRESAAEK